MNFYVYDNTILSHEHEGFKKEFPSHMEALKYLSNNHEAVEAELLKSLSDNEIDEGWSTLRKEYTTQKHELNSIYEKEITDIKKEIQIRQKRKSMKARREENELRNKLQLLENEWNKKIDQLSNEYHEKLNTNPYYQEEKRRAKIKSEKYRQEQQHFEEKREIERLERNHKIIMQNGGYEKLLDEYNAKLRKQEGILKRAKEGTYNHSLIESRINSIKREIEEILRTQEYIKQKSA